jgi:hypothetical protein
MPHSMSAAQDQMKKALKDIVIPRLRERGFTGSFPHLRRRRPERIDLLTFQFDRHGGGFIIEIGQCPPDGFTTYWGKRIAPDKVTAWDLSPKQRARVKPGAGSGPESWFRYDAAANHDAFAEAAAAVLPFVDPAERMFDNFDRVSGLG